MKTLKVNTIEFKFKGGSPLLFLLCLVRIRPLWPNRSRAWPWDEGDEFEWDEVRSGRRPDGRA